MPGDPNLITTQVFGRVMPALRLNIEHGAFVQLCELHPFQKFG
jgi:hypothetical protein